MKKVNDKTLSIPDSNNNEKMEIKRGIPYTKNTKKIKIFKILIASEILIIIISIILFIILSNKKHDSNFDSMVDSSYVDSVTSKKITKEDLKIAKYNTVIKLNQIELPSFQSKILYNEEYLSSFYNFTYKFFKKLNYESYSPITLYNILINVYMAISDKEQSEILDSTTWIK